MGSQEGVPPASTLSCLGASLSIAHEITLVLEGKIRICGHILGPGEIIVIEPEEVSAFEALTDVRIVVVKSLGALNDKYMAYLSD